MSEPITLRQWTDVVRRARLGRTVKAVAMVLATYADADGTRVRPGIARLAYECEVSYNTAQDAVSKLRKAGLIELVRPAGAHGRRRIEADEYRLTFDATTADVPTPAQAAVAIDAIRRAKQGRYRSGSHPSPLGADEPLSHPTGMGAEDASHPTAQGAVGADLHPTPLGAIEPIAPHGACQIAPHGAGAHHPLDQDTTTTTHCIQDVDASVTGPRAREPTDDNPNPIEAAKDFARRRRERHVAPAARATTAADRRVSNRVDSAPKCPHHRGQPAHNCAPCRAERLAAA